MDILVVFIIIGVGLFLSFNTYGWVLKFVEFLCSKGGNNKL